MNKKLRTLLNVDFVRVEISRVLNIDEKEVSYSIERFADTETSTFCISYKNFWIYFDLDYSFEIDTEDDALVIDSKELESGNVFDLSKGESDYYSLAYGEDFISVYQEVLESLTRDIKSVYIDEDNRLRFSYVQN